MENIYDVIIIGSGPAGLTAAIYTTRASLKTLVIAGTKWGGQLQLTSVIENFPGFPEGIEGPQLMLNMRKQAEHFGAELMQEDFTEADFSKQPFTIKTASGKTVTGKAVILATGADAMWLNVPGEQALIGRGVSSCATCDAAFFRNKKVIVVGGGDSAMEEALVLAKVAEHVTLIHRRDTFRASEIMQKRVKEHAKITIMYNSAITKVLGEFKVTGATVKNLTNDQEQDIAVDGIFVAIGHKPNTQVLKGIELDEKGYVKVQDHYRTNVEGVFTAGDVHDKQYRQAITAAGFGCASALEVEKWLEMEK